MLKKIFLTASFFTSFICHAGSVEELKHSIAQDIFTHWNSNKDIIDEQFSLGKFTVDIDGLVLSTETKSKVDQLETEILEQRGLDNELKDFVIIRIANPGLYPLWQANISPLIVPDADGNENESVNAYNLSGETEELSPTELPNKPVLVLDIQRSKIMRETARSMNQIIQKTLNKSGIRTALNENTEPEEEEFPEEIHTSVIKKFRAEYIKELWLQPAEVYAIVTGVSPSRMAPQIDIVEMPVVDYPKIEYPINQIAIYWQRYRWAAADMIFMEMDDKVQYKDIAQNLVKIAEEVLNNIEDPRVQKYAVIPQITNRIMDAFPESMWVDNDDVIDAVYTIQQNATYTDHTGAGGNVTVSIEPLVIGEVEL